MCVQHYHRPMVGPAADGAAIATLLSVTKQSSAAAAIRQQKC